MIRVILESPYAGGGERLRYLQECLRDSLSRGEAPFASHQLYTSVLDDTVSTEREMGIAAGFAWFAVADRMIVYKDLGISPGMERGIARATSFNLPIEYRSIR